MHWNENEKSAIPLHPSYSHSLRFAVVVSLAVFDLISSHKRRVYVSLNIAVILHSHAIPVIFIFN